MKRVSPKRAKINHDASGERNAYKALFPWCQYPGCDRQAVETHEISRGPSRSKSLGVRAALLNLCRPHHDEIHRSPSVVRDLAMKRIADPEGYDRRRVNELRGRQPDAITEAEVLEWVDRFESAESRQIKELLKT